jgi:hypothetical protein
MTIITKKLKKRIPEQHFYHKYQNISFLNKRFLSVGLIWGLNSLFGGRFAPPPFSAQGAERGGHALSKKEEASSLPYHTNKGSKGQGFDAAAAW